MMGLAAALALFAVQAAEPGHYGAIGTNPLWQASIGDGFISFETQERGTLSLPAPARQATTGGFSYRTDQLTITVTHGACTDALTHRVYADRVIVENAGARFEGCGGARRGANAPAPYGASGSEPFWSLEIADGRLYFGINDEVVLIPAPRPTITNNGRTRRYRAPGIEVILRRENCDFEDERVYADDVTVIAGHWRVDGCGGRVVREAPGD
jgi:uncharacterized membrane protein